VQYWSQVDQGVDLLLKPAGGLDADQNGDDFDEDTVQITKNITPGAILKSLFYLATLQNRLADTPGMNNEASKIILKDNPVDIFKTTRYLQEKSLTLAARQPSKPKQSADKGRDNAGSSLRFDTNNKGGKRGGSTFKQKTRLVY
jgi:hypothetical protein